MLVEMTRREVEELEAVLRERLAELSQEIYHAEVSDFHDELKERKAVLEGALKKLEAAIGKA
jgi:hypothetical protein